MIPFLLWYIVISLLGLAVFPLAYRLLPALSDRGYTLSRTIGLLIWGFIFWLLGSLGILKNDTGGQLLALLLLLVLSGLAMRGTKPADLLAWFKSRLSLIIAVEILFMTAFAFMAFIRAANPETVGTEKPMEMAFINSILRSPTFPPNDPWLSGYGISYYYFGYVLVAMLSRISGTAGSLGFNLGLSLAFSLSTVGIYGLVFNLLQARRPKPEAMEGDPSLYNPITNLIYPLFGPLFLLLVSNLEGFLEILHGKGIFWKMNPAGGGTSGFWSWLDILNLRDPPTLPLTWSPRHWWWWRASRVLQDYDLAHGPREIIDEFPAFSYLLGDLHPHVLAMPFAFLGLALALNLILGGCRGQVRLPGIKTGLHINIQSLAFAALAFGGIAFINFWDFPTYVALFCGTYVLVRTWEKGWKWERLIDFLIAFFAVGILSVLLYMPFYLGFSSQAGGIIPSLIYATRGAHLWVMFAPLLIPMIIYLAYLWKSYGNMTLFKKGLWLGAGIILVLWLTSTVIALLAISIPGLPYANIIRDAIAPGINTVSSNAPIWLTALGQALQRRIVNAGGWLTVLSLIILTTGLLAKNKTKEQSGITDHGEDSPDTPLLPAHAYSLMLVFIGALLALGSEFYFLRDQFGWRMNTIFKFYFQTWILWAAVAAYGTCVLLQVLKGAWGVIFRIGLVIVIAASLVYPVLGFWTKTNGFNPPQGLSLDGSAHLGESESAAVEWLKSAPPGNLVEAVRADGGQYSDFANIATYSGLPTVLGWVGHESQWGRDGAVLGTRQNDIERLYTTRDWTEAQAILDKYNIRYVILGPRERSTYRVFEPKFQRFLNPVFNLGDIIIYEVP